MTTQTTEYTGRSVLDDLSPGTAPSSPLPPPSTVRSLLLTLASGREVVVQHDGDPWDAPRAFTFGENFVVFGGGHRVRADRIEEARELAASEVAAAQAGANVQEAVPVQIVGAEPTPAAEGVTLEDLPYAVWPLAALEDALKRKDPSGIADSEELREIRTVLAKRREIVS